MKLARYWTRATGEVIGRDGQRVRATSRGWSNDSMEAARVLARDVARRVAERIATNPADRKQYLYGERPLPEPVLREFQNDGEGAQAVITRNLYGALVMNSRHLMFVDIDRESAAPPAAAALVSGLLSLFGKSTPAPSQPADPVINEIQRVADRHNLSGRVYKLRAGIAR